MLNRLIREALRGSHLRSRHATLLLRGGSVVSWGYNHDGRHAEMVALGKVWPNKRKGLSAVNLRLNRRGFVGMSRPCAECWRMLAASGVRKVTYSTGTGWRTERI